MAVLDFFVKKDKVYDYLYIYFAVFMFFIAGFRGMGNDYENYKEIFESICDLNFAQIFDPEIIYVEPGFATLNYALGNLPYQSILVVMSGLNIAILWPFIRKYSPYPYITLIMFFGMFMYSGVMGVMRQHLAIAICLWAMSNPKSKKFWWLLFLALMFHYSAIFIILVKFLKNTYYSARTYLIIIGIAILSNLLFYEGFKVISGFMPSFIAWKLNIYLAEEAGVKFGLNAAVIIRLLAFGLAYINREKIAAKFPKYGPLFINIYFLAIIIYTGFGFLPQVASRGAIYFHYIEIFIIPMVLYVSNNFNRSWILTLFVLFSLWRHYELVTYYAEVYLPYKNILFP